MGVILASVRRILPLRSILASIRPILPIEVFSIHHVKQRGGLNVVGFIFISWMLDGSVLRAFSEFLCIHRYHYYCTRGRRLRHRNYPIHSFSLCIIFD